MKIRNIIGHGGQAVRNQFIVTDDHGNTFFQSYETIIAKQDRAGRITLDAKKWDCSVTTGKYRNIFLSEDKATTAKKIKAGTYKLADLNGGK